MPFVSVPGPEVQFCIRQTRESDFAAFVELKLYDAQFEWRAASKRANHPVANVNWFEAKAFCEWLTRHEQVNGTISTGMMYRLPTDVEWSHAVGIGERQITGTPYEKLLATVPDMYPRGTT